MRYPANMLALVIWLVCAAPPAELTAPARDYADVAVVLSGTDTRILNLRRARFDKPTALPRYRGRFSVRVLKGARVLEEVRFDFPLYADAETDDAPDEARRFAEGLRKGLTVRATVRVPLPEGADALALIDSKSGKGPRLSLSEATAPSPSPQGAARAGAPPAR